MDKLISYKLILNRPIRPGALAHFNKHGNCHLEMSKGPHAPWDEVLIGRDKLSVIKDLITLGAVDSYEVYE